MVKPFSVFTHLFLLNRYQKVVTENTYSYNVGDYVAIYVPIISVVL